MQKLCWDDYRVAYQVAQSGSLSKAAEVMGCNHATVLRHVNRLEKALNIKLFIRHQRGYKLTDAGTILTNELPNIFSEFSRLESLLGSVEQDISGNLRITSLAEFAALLNPALLAFRQKHPNLRIQLISTDEVIPLASGAAHVSLRAGSEPQDPDLIAKKIMPVNMAYYASDEYVERYGLPQTLEAFNEHDWVIPSAEKRRIPYVKKILEHIDNERIVFQSNHFIDINSAVVTGIGIGLMSAFDASQYDNLQKLNTKGFDDKQMDALWFVYHRDLKNNAKIKALYSSLIDHLNL